MFHVERLQDGVENVDFEGVDEMRCKICTFGMELGYEKLGLKRGGKRGVVRSWDGYVMGAGETWTRGYIGSLPP